MFFFFSDEEALAAMVKMNGRFYAGKQISCEPVLIKSWKSAICGKVFNLFLMPYLWARALCFWSVCSFVYTSICHMKFLVHLVFDEVEVK